MSKHPSKKTIRVSAGISTAFSIIIAFLTNIFTSLIQESYKPYANILALLLIITSILLIWYASHIANEENTRSEANTTNTNSQQNSGLGHNTQTNVNNPTAPVNFYTTNFLNTEIQSEKTLSPSEKIIKYRLSKINEDNISERKIHIETIAQVAENDSLAYVQLVGLLIHSLEDVRVQTAILIVEQRQDIRALPVLVKGLLSKNHPYQNDVATALSKLGAPSIPHLTEIINTTNSDQIRKLAVIALGKINDPASLPGLIRALDFKDVRDLAINLLGNLRNPAAIDNLISLLGELLSTGIDATSALIKIGSPAVPALCTTLEKASTHQGAPELIAARHAALALGTINDLRAVPYLIKALDYKEHSVREEARIALEKIGRARYERRQSPLNVIRSDGNTIKLLSKSISDHVLQELLDRLNDDIEVNKIDVSRSISWSIIAIFEQIQTERAIDGLIKALRNEHLDLKNLVARDLGQLGNAKAIPELLTALYSEDEYDGIESFKITIIEALKAIGTSVANEEVDKFLIYSKLQDKLKSIDKTDPRELDKIIELGEQILEMYPSTNTGREITSRAYKDRVKKNLEENNFLSHQDLDRSAILKPNDPETSFIRGNYYLNTKKFDLALLDFQNYKNNSSDPSSGYYFLGLTYKAQGNTASARFNFQKATESITDLVDEKSIYINKAKKELAELDVAVAKMRQQQAEREIPGLLHQLEQAFEKEDWPKAIIIGETILDLEKNHQQALKITAESYRRRGVISQQQGNIEMALEDFNKTIELQPNIGSAYYNRGMLFKEKNVMPKFVEDMNKAKTLGVISAHTELKNSGYS